MLVAQLIPPRNRECFVGTAEITVVLMAGLPCTGKTRLAYALQEALGWQVVDKDRYIVEELLNRGLKADSCDDEASSKAYDRSFEELRTLLREQRKSVILDTAALRPFILNEVEEIVESLPNTQLKVILCNANYTLRYERLRERLKRRSRHPKSNINIGLTTNDGDLKRFEHLPESKKILDTSRPFEECLAEAIAYLLS